MAKKKVMDKWKAKKWYTIMAPETFDKKEIGSLLSDEDWKLINRKIRISLGELTQDFSQMQNFIIFRIVKIQGTTAFTEVTGQELSKTYLKTLVRRRTDVIDMVIDSKTNDGVNVRIKAVAYSQLKLTGPTKTDIRNRMASIIKSSAENMPFSQLIQEIVFGKFSVRIFGAIKKIGPIRRVEIRKTEVKNVVEVERPAEVEEAKAPEEKEQKQEAEKT